METAAGVLSQVSLSEAGLQFSGSFFSLLYDHYTLTFFVSCSRLIFVSTMSTKRQNATDVLEDTELGWVPVLLSLGPRFVVNLIEHGPVGALHLLVSGQQC